MLSALQGASSKGTAQTRIPNTDLENNRLTRQETCQSTHTTKPNAGCSRPKPRRRICDWNEVAGVRAVIKLSNKCRRMTQRTSIEEVVPPAHKPVRCRGERNVVREIDFAPLRWRFHGEPRDLAGESAETAVDDHAVVTGLRWLNVGQDEEARARQSIDVGAIKLSLVLAEVAGQDRHHHSVTDVDCLVCGLRENRYRRER